jgi:hypothetical protein
MKFVESAVELESLYRNIYGQESVLPRRLFRDKKETTEKRVENCI